MEASLRRLPMDELKAYRPQEIARMLGLSKSTTYRLLRSGRLPGRRLGFVWFVLKEDLERTLEEAKFEAGN
jgi:excisionase family DNA binding protein